MGYSYRQRSFLERVFVPLFQRHGNLPFCSVLSITTLFANEMDRYGGIRNHPWHFINKGDGGKVVSLFSEPGLTVSTLTSIPAIGEGAVGKNR
jgi:hypothetical protein